MQGFGSLIINNVACLLSGSGILKINNNNVTLNGSATLYAFPSTLTTGSVSLPALTSVGGNTTYAFASQTLPALTSTGNNEYVPVVAPYGYAVLPALASYGYAAGIAYGEAVLPSLQSAGGNVGYCYGSVSLPALKSFGIYTDRLKMALFGRMAMSSAGSMTRAMRMSMLSSMTMTSAGTMTKRQYLAMLGSMSLASHSTILGRYKLALQGEMYLQSVSLLRKDAYPVLEPTSRTWAVNLDTFAAGQYDDYGFTAFFTKDGISYGIAKDGIYELNGADDAGREIDALVDFGKSDLGAPNKKTIPAYYLGVSSTDKMLLEVEADGQSYTYEARSSSTTMNSQRIDIGKGLKGTYWQATLKNQNGCAFDLETISFNPVALARKI